MLKTYPNIENHEVENLTSNLDVNAENLFIFLSLVDEKNGNF